MKQISFGAEGSIFLTKNNTLLKIREPQAFRHPQLDLKIRKKRTKREIKVLEKLKEYNISAPHVISTNLDECSFEMNKVEGKLLHECFSINLIKKAIIQIAKMHLVGVVHSDLTPLNMIYNEFEDQIYLIDFGLADFTTNREDRAVDLNVFFTILENDYSTIFDHKKELLDLYKEQFENKQEVQEILERLENVESRGRNKAKN